MANPLLNGLANGLANGLGNGLAGRNGVLEIMPLGDSITRGEDARTIRPLQNGYRDNLGSRLDSANIDFNFVGSLRNGVGFDNNHEGHAGKTIEFLDQNVNRWLRRNPAEVVLLQVGSNDMGFLPRQSPMSAVSQLGDLIDKISNRVPDAEILVASITPVNPANFPNAQFGEEVLPNFQNRVQVFNALLPGLVQTKASEGKSVTFVDVNSALNPIRDISIDGLHPTEQGYDKIASTYFSAIQEIVNDPANGIANSTSAGGGIGADTIGGFNGDDMLVSGSGNNFLLGGNNLLQGMSTGSSRSPQLDSLYGGSPDMYVMPSGMLRERIGLGSDRYQMTNTRGDAGIFDGNNGLLSRIGQYPAQAFDSSEASDFIRS